MTKNTWIMTFDVAGLFAQENDFYLTPKILIKKSIEKRIIFRDRFPIHRVEVKLTDDDIEEKDRWDEYFQWLQQTGESFQKVFLNTSININIFYLKWF